MIKPVSEGLSYCPSYNLKYKWFSTACSRKRQPCLYFKKYNNPLTTQTLFQRLFWLPVSILLCLPVVASARCYDCPLLWLPIVVTAPCCVCSLLCLPVLVTAHCYVCPLLWLPIVVSARCCDCPLLWLPVFVSAWCCVCRCCDCPLLWLPVVVTTLLFPSCNNAFFREVVKTNSLRLCSAPVTPVSLPTKFPV